MTLENAGTLNTGLLTMQEIEKRYWNNNIVLFNIKETDKNEVTHAEVYYYVGDDWDGTKALYAMAKAEKEGCKNTLIRYIGDDRLAIEQ
jgi:hypothetical protein